MGRFSYHSYGYGHSDHFEIKANGVAVDLDRKILRITATWTGYGKEPITEEFPLLSLRTCTKCGEPVSIYASGSMAGLNARTAGAKLFAEPWSYGKWKLLKVEGGFALVANERHGAKADSYSCGSGCSGSKVKLAFLAIA